jgi:alpha-2-macroglobulin
MLRLILPTVALIAIAIALTPTNAHAENAPASLASLLKMQQDGNFKTAYDGLRSLVLSNDAAETELPKAFDAAIECLRQLNRVDEIDAFREEAVKAHTDNWRLLAAVAQSNLNVEHYGYMIGGEFRRGHHERDRPRPRASDAALPRRDEAGRQRREQSRTG